jgi:hypothetical protein
MNRRKVVIGGVVVLLMAVVAGWAFGLFGGTDPAIARLQEIGDQMNASNLADGQRDQLRDQFRTQMRSLTDDQRRAFFDANRGQWEARSAQRMNEFFAMSKSDQTKRLDEIINRSLQQQKQNQGKNANRGGGGNRGSMSEAQREERSKRRLDSTSPRMRAQYAEFRKQLDQRAAQRGVKVDNGWGRGGIGGRG